MTRKKGAQPATRWGTINNLSHLDGANLAIALP